MKHQGTEVAEKPRSDISPGENGGGTDQMQREKEGMDERKEQRGRTIKRVNVSYMDAKHRGERGKGKARQEQQPKRETTCWKLR